MAVDWSTLLSTSRSERRRRQQVVDGDHVRPPPLSNEEIREKYLTYFPALANTITTYSLAVHRSDEIAAAATGAATGAGGGAATSIGAARTTTTAATICKGGGGEKDKGDANNDFPVFRPSLLGGDHKEHSGRSDDDSPRKSSRVVSKGEIVDLRRALRFGLSCLSFQSADAEVAAASVGPEQKDHVSSAPEEEDSSIQRMAQNEAVFGRAGDGVGGGGDECIFVVAMHRRLSLLISLEGTDSKCRETAAKLLCNLVTANRKTAIAVANDIDLSPPTCLVASPSSHPCSSNWVDMVSTAARKGERHSVAVVVAALHNCLAALPVIDSSPECGYAMEEEEEEEGGGDKTNARSRRIRREGRINSYEEFARSIAADRVLMSNLVRSILPSDAIHRRRQRPPAPAPSSQEETGSGASIDIHDASASDEATEWISLLLERIAASGSMPLMFDSLSLSGTTSAKDEEGGSNLLAITPELVVLLHCIGRAVDVAMLPSGGDGGGGSGDRRRAPQIISKAGPLGKDGESVHRTLNFVVQKAMVIRKFLERKTAAAATTTKGCREEEEERFEGESDCARSAYICILEMLAASLACDDVDDDRNGLSLSSLPMSSNSTAAASRIYFGRDMGMLTACVRDIGDMVDRHSDCSAQGRGGVHKRNRNAMESDMMDSEQRLIVVLVRLIGNLCYKCKVNQDLLRTVKVPRRSDAEGRFENAKEEKGDNVIEGRGEGPSPTRGPEGLRKFASPAALRTGLHVLLSCTSLSYGCFTLREWSIVAIRNALDGNVENQRMVERLEGQEAVGSPVLDDLGFEIGLGDDGRVRVNRKPGHLGGAE